MKTQPTQSNERIVSLDVLRGFAVLGILVVNLQAFSMIEVAFFNPVTFGNFEGINKLTWIIIHVFFEMKFMAVFSTLFGAGIVLFTTRLEAKGNYSLKIHFRRIGWLLLFGMAHAYLLWHYDVLVCYAICGMWVVFMRNWNPKKLLITGLIFFSIGSIIYIVIGLIIPHLGEENIAFIVNTLNPGADLIQNEVEALQGSWIEQMPFRIESAITVQVFSLVQWNWRAGGLMLLGMALYKWGILSAEKSTKFYIKLSVYCLIIGFLLVSWGLKSDLDKNFHMPESFFLTSQYNYWGSLFISLGYIGLIMLMVKANILNLLKKSLQAVGQMAFTNYLMQSIICTFIFYGHGFGLFGKVDRAEQMIYVAAIFLLQMIYSPFWLNYFKYGPFEWAWRSLTYWKIQPIKK